MKYLGERIKYARVQAGLSQEELAERLGVMPLTVGRYEQGRQSPSRRLESIAGLLGKPVAWFMIDDPAPAGPRKVARSRVRRNRVEPMKRPFRPQPKRTPDEEAFFVSVPLYDEVPAGPFAEVIEETTGTVYIPARWRRGDAVVYCMRVRGDSMHPGVNHGDLIAVRHQKTAENGDIVVAVTDRGEGAGYTLKRWMQAGDKVILRADNPASPDLYPSDVVRVAGKVVGLIRDL